MSNLERTALVLVHPEPLSESEAPLILAGLETLSSSLHYPAILNIVRYLSNDKIRDSYEYIALLALTADDWNSPVLHPGITQHQDEIDFIPWTSLEEQVANIKKVLFYKKVDRVDLAGFALGCCIDDTQMWLSGKETKAISSFIEAPEPAATLIQAHIFDVRILSDMCM